jgi:hypothetical protein
MPQTIVNPRTGLKRRQPPRSTTRKRRANSLYTTKRDIAQRLQNEMKLTRKNISMILVVAIVCLVRIRILRAREHDQDNQASIARLHRLGTIALLAAALYQQKYLVLRHEDELLCDIPLEEENEASYKHPARWQRIEDFQNDNESNNKTNYTKGELWELVEHFGMEDIVRVPIPNSTSRYTFHREELLIYTLIKMKTGVAHTYMEEYVTHSDARRWSYGYKHFVR